MKLATTVIATILAAGSGYVAQPAMQAVSASRTSGSLPVAQGFDGAQQGVGGRQPMRDGTMRGRTGTAGAGPLAGISVDEDKLTCTAGMGDEAHQEDAGGAARDGAPGRAAGRGDARKVHRELMCRVAEALGVELTPGERPAQQLREHQREQVKEAAQDALASMVQDGILTQEQADNVQQAREERRQGGGPQSGGPPSAGART